MHPLDAWNSVQNFYVQNLSVAYAQHFMMQTSIDNVLKILSDPTANADTKECMSLMIKIAGAKMIQDDIAAWLEAEYFSPTQAQMVRDGIEGLLSQAKRHVIRLTYAMLPYEGLIESMIAPEDGRLYESVINRVYTSPDAFGRISNWKEIYQNHM